MASSFSTFLPGLRFDSSCLGLVPVLRNLSRTSSLWLSASSQLHSSPSICKLSRWTLPGERQQLKDEQRSHTCQSVTTPLNFAKRFLQDYQPLATFNDWVLPLLGPCFGCCLRHLSCSGALGCSKRRLIVHVSFAYVTILGRRCLKTRCRETRGWRGAF